MARTQTSTKDWPEDRPELLPFLPLVYAAWSDGVLSGGELEAIRGRVTAQPWLTEGARDTLADWLDPENPPSPTSLAGLKDQLRALGATPEAESSRSLVELGLD